ncbi:site-specific integrase [Brucella ciceri]|uniref:tyrosine-type recombinase/integrase n=1 Tax=Brucella ciceri TaxID=391287 RepID=UPI001F12AF5E|nr:tyrosine-type recombinase/integrase [Brucella ciceri]MCH6205901.1 site-specific integrase [Brucella ciceri]
MTDQPLPLILKIADWPEADRKLWERSFAPGGLFDDDNGVFASWSDGTRRLHAQNYGSWLSFLLRFQPDLIRLPPTDRITRETVAAYIEEGMQRLKLRSISNQTLSLAVIARGFELDGDWGWLFNAARTLYEQSDPHRLKPPIPIEAADLHRWSLGQLNRLTDIPQTDPLSNAVAFRQALMVGFLIARPVRVRALAAMTIDRHLEIAEHGITLRFSAADMKDKRKRRFPLPEQLVPFMQAYLDVHRQILLQGNLSQALWISGRGHDLSIDSITSGLALLTNRVFGLTLRPHSFRSIAATSIATFAPEHVGIIRDILGHASMRMAEQHYNRATAVEASRRQQDVLRGLRREGKKNRRNKSRLQRPHSGNEDRTGNEDRD